VISTLAFALAVAVPLLSAVVGLLFLAIAGLAHYRTP
jgi:hypothetical protein